MLTVPDSELVHLHLSLIHNLYLMLFKPLVYHLVHLVFLAGGLSYCMCSLSGAVSATFSKMPNSGRTLAIIHLHHQDLPSFFSVVTQP